MDEGPYRIVNGRLVRGHTDIASLENLTDREQVFMLELLNLAYLIGHNHGEQKALEAERTQKA